MLFSIKAENLKLASRSRDYMKKSTIENLKTCQPREQLNMQLSFDKRCSFPTQNSAFSLGQTRLMSGKLSRLKSKQKRKNRHASGLNENGSSNLSTFVHSFGRLFVHLFCFFVRSFVPLFFHFSSFHRIASYKSMHLSIHPVTRPF